jgi:hypothetical protein
VHVQVHIRVDTCIGRHVAAGTLQVCVVLTTTIKCACKHERAYVHVHTATCVCTCTCTFCCLKAHYVRKETPKKKRLSYHTCASSETPVPWMHTASSSSSSYHAHGESAAALSYKRIEGFPPMSSLMVPSMMVYIYNVKHIANFNNGWTD